MLSQCERGKGPVGVSVALSDHERGAGASGETLRVMVLVLPQFRSQDGGATGRGGGRGK